ncbi:MAG TPA: hypothetical protein VMT94_00065 [Burkholderiales bacterium]|nr:hypothetical protein [Burkholderiales bacterium]
MSDPARTMAEAIYIQAVVHDVVMRTVKGCDAAEMDYRRLSEEAWRAAKAFSKCSYEGASRVDV